MNKFGRILLWLIPFMWPVALWRSIRHGQQQRDARMVAALGGPHTHTVTPLPSTGPQKAPGRFDARMAARIGGTCTPAQVQRVRRAALAVLLVGLVLLATH